MADTLITNLTSGGTALTTDEIPVNRSGTDRKLTAGSIANLAISTATGTSFPVSPATNDRYFRTDRNIEYVWDGTRWLSTHLYTEVCYNFDNTAPRTTTGQSLRGVNPFAGKYDIYVEDLVLWYAIAGTGNWTVTFSGMFTVSPAVFSGLTTNAGDNLRHPYNTVVASTVDNSLDATATENSGTASFYGIVSYTYRLVG